MPFYPNDIYATSAGTEIFNYFNPFVTKFDAESFYNFEQDNQPLYDLEERTFGLWEKATGYATSSLNGMPLVVSGSTFTGNRNVFTNLQDAINSLPNVIRTPTLVEVATSGYLGGLELKNIKIVEDGVLEIINRGCAKIYSGKGGIVSTSSVGLGTAGDLANETYITSISSVDLSATITNTSAMGAMDRRGYLVGGVNCSGIFDSIFNRTFVQVINIAQGGRRTGRLSLGFVDPLNLATGPLVSGTGAFAFNVANYELNAFGLTGNVTDKTPGSSDVSAVRGDTQARLSRTTTEGEFNDTTVAGLTYANAVSSITVENCNGPLYIRGFCVDGVKGSTDLYLNSTYKNPVGISVVNSNPVIENCSVMRCTETGAKFVDSDVTLARGFFANRNYLVNDSGNGRSSTETVGLHAINSNVNLEINALYASGSDYLFNTQNHTYGAIFENSTIRGGQGRPQPTENDACISFGYNEVGFKAINSTIALSGNLDVYNNHMGMKLINTHLSTDRLTVENQTFNGIDAENSVINYNNSHTRKDYRTDADGKRITQTEFLYNGSHLNLHSGSRFTYFKDSTTSATPVNIHSKFGGLRFADNHGVSSVPGIKLSNSKADLLHPRIIASSTQIQTLRMDVKGAAVQAENSSEVTFLGTQNGATLIEGNPAINTGGRRVAGVYAGDNSKVSFRGPTAIVQFGTNVLANRNSVMEFVPHRNAHGRLDIEGFNLTNTRNHTCVELHSINKACLAANNSSNIVMEDLGSVQALYLSAGSTDYNQAVIANCVSAGSIQFYPNPALGSYANSTDDVSLPDDSISDDIFTASTITGSNFYSSPTNYNYKLNDYHGHDASNIINNTVSRGGMCLQAFGNSIVNVNNVHFPTGWANAEGTFYDTSATADRCNQLRMWLFGHGSKLYASHIALSGTAPSALDHPNTSQPVYYGPRSVYLSGLSNNDEYGAGTVIDVEGDSARVAYNALSSTPNTSSLSVLDSYGLGVQISGTFGIGRSGGGVDAITSALNDVAANRKDVYGYLVAQNRGPFRLFFAPNPAMRFVGYASGAISTFTGHPQHTQAEQRGTWATRDTRPMQHIAQGYNLSGPVGVPDGILAQEGGMEPSSMHNILINTFIGANDFGAEKAGGVPFAAASGYYYPSGMLPAEGIVAYIDQSAADVFANAKHCARSPLSGGMDPLVSIYRSTLDSGGVGAAGTAGTSRGVGIRSLNIIDNRRDV